MGDIPVSTFHLGFILSTAFCSATIHLMIVIGQPDLTDRDTRESWISHLRFLQFFMFVPLVGFYLTHSAENPETGSWFLGTLLICCGLFVPPELAVRRSVPKEETQARPALKSVATSRAELEAVAQTHLRILFGNFALGLLMGLAILVPLVCSIVFLTGLGSFGFLTQEQVQTALQFVPAFCSMIIPVAMPMAFLMFGPFVLRVTQRARSLQGDHTYSRHWEVLRSRSRELGYTNFERIRLFELPWEHTSFKNAFFVGWASRFNPFPSGIFLVKGIEKVLNEGEMKFVISHEVAHGLSRHGIRRMTLGMSVFIFFIVTQAVSLWMRAPALAFVLAFVALFWGWFLMKRQAEIQEFEADIIAMNLQDSDPEALACAMNALRKLNEFNKAATKTPGDPLIDRRIASLEALFGSRQRQSGDQRRAA